MFGPLCFKTVLPTESEQLTPYSLLACGICLDICTHIAILVKLCRPGRVQSIVHTMHLNPELCVRIYRPHNPRYFQCQWLYFFTSCDFYSMKMTFSFLHFHVKDISYSAIMDKTTSSTYIISILFYYTSHKKVNWHSHMKL